MSGATTILVAASVFVVTNIDDLFVMSAFMSDPAYRLRDVVLGQFLGATAMTLLCLVLAWAAIGVSSSLFGWLGAIEIGIGVKKLFERYRGAREIGPDERRGRGGLRTVAFATVGGFGDNVGVYVPLFAAGRDAGVICTVFGAMTGLWCYGAYRLVGRDTPLGGLRECVARFLPWILIAIGIAILSRAGSLAPLLSTVTG